MRRLADVNLRFSAETRAGLTRTSGMRGFATRTVGLVVFGEVLVGVGVGVMV